LRRISQQANLSLIEISRKTGLSLDIVKYRLQQLNKNIILSNRILLNFNRIGYYHHVILLKIRRASLEEENKLVSWCASQPSVLYCSKRIGQYDFEINPAIKDIGELNSLLEELKKEFYEIIDSHEVIIISKLLKLNYIPF
jgi:DNA-binding Lrp family transcriptional regulator